MTYTTEKGRIGMTQKTCTTEKEGGGRLCMAGWGGGGLTKQTASKGRQLQVTRTLEGKSVLLHSSQTPTYYYTRLCSQFFN